MAKLLDAGYVNVRRYQLGIPVWRAIGGVAQIEPASIRTVIENDKTAISLMSEIAAEFKQHSESEESSS